MKADRSSARKEKLVDAVKVLSMLIIGVIICGALAACSSDSIAGTYFGSSGSELVIDDDGTLQYTQQSWDGEWSDGSWAEKNDGTYSLLVNRFDYGLIAEKNKDGDLVVEGDGSFDSQSWTTEIFSKE